jgi:hypothetical protein
MTAECGPQRKYAKLRVLDVQYLFRVGGDSLTPPELLVELDQKSIKRAVITACT